MKKILHNFYEDKIWIYTFISLLLKYSFFQGFTLGKAGTQSYFIIALTMAIPRLPYQIGFTGLFLCFAFLIRGRIRLWSLLFFNSLVSILLLIDLWYYRGFKSMPSVHLLKQASNLDNLSGSILSLVTTIDFILILDIILLVIIAIKSKKLNSNSKPSIILFSIIFTISFSLLAYIPTKEYLFKIEDEKAIFSLLDSNITAYNISPLGYHALNLYSFIQDSASYVLNNENKKEIENWFSKKESLNTPNNFKGIFSGKNLIVLQLESFEFSVLNKVVDGQELTPNLNKLYKNSLTFTKIHEQVNQGTTSDAEFMINTGIYPLREGSTFFRFPYNKYPSFPKLLEEKGYSTLAIHSDKGSYWNWMTALSSIGFKNCIDSSYFKYDEAIGMGLSDGSYLKQILPILEKQKQPFYSFIVTLSNHAPFDLPAKFRELKFEENFDKSTVGGYFQSVRYVDTQIGKFVEGLNANGLLENTVLALSGDHEGIHKYYESDVNTWKDKEPWLKSNDKLLPFIVYSPGVTHELIETNGGQVDIMPTLSYLMDIEESKYSKSTSGRNLLNTNESFAVLKNGELVGNETGLGKEHALQGLNIADMLIRGNYYSK